MALCFSAVLINWRPDHEEVDREDKISQTFLSTTMEFSPIITEAPFRPFSLSAPRTICRVAPHSFLHSEKSVRNAERIVEVLGSRQEIIDRLGAFLALAHASASSVSGPMTARKAASDSVVIARRHLVKPPHGLRRRAPEPGKALVPTPLQFGIDPEVHLHVRHSNPFQNC